MFSQGNALHLQISFKQGHAGDAGGANCRIPTAIYRIQLIRALKNNS